MRITLESTGNFKKTMNFLEKASNMDFEDLLNHYGELGVIALALTTPIDTGKTASSWDYNVRITDDSATITWTNDNFTSNGIPIVVLIQYGHGTRNGAYVQGRDFINPALQPIFDDIADKISGEVKKL